MASTLSEGDGQALLRAAIGQSDASMTPAQMAQLLSCIVNGGTRYQGYLLYDVRNFTSGDVVSKTQATALSSLTLNAEGRHLLIKTMADIAKKDSSLMGCQQNLADKGLTLGCFYSTSPSGTVADSHAILLGFVTPSVGEGASLCVSVVVENGGEAEKFSSIISSIVGEYEWDS